MPVKNPLQHYGLLMLSMFPSAQVADRSYGWPVLLPPGHVAVLGGHTLEFATGGALHATHHAVKVRSSPARRCQR